MNEDGDAERRRAFRFILAGELGLFVFAVTWAAFETEPIPLVLTGSSAALAGALTFALALVNFSLFFAGRRLELARPVYELFEEEIFPIVRAASWVELLAAAALAGLAEELLFRGLLQPRMGIVASSVLFGVLHGPSFKLWPLALWAGLVSVAFGISYDWTENLAVPVMVHGCYDALALAYVRGARRPALRSRHRIRDVAFVKAEANGNDFLLVSDRDYLSADGTAAADFARAICDRQRGLGADGLIFFGRSGERHTMTLYNSDGSPAELSGNGLRCLGAHLYHSGLAGDDREIEVSTGAGVLSLRLVEQVGPRFRFRADMGRPTLGAAKLSVELGGRELEVDVVSMGNPHAVIFTEAFDRDELLEIGPPLERHERFPEGTNVELVQVMGPHAIRMGIWERGAGETASSGTGSAASAVAAVANGFVESPVAVHCPGGTLTVEWPERGNVLVTGDATIVAKGRFVWSRRTT